MKHLNASDSDEWRGLESSVPTALPRCAARRGFLQPGALNPQAPPKSLLFHFEHYHISAKKETNLPAACGARVGDKHVHWEV